MHNGTREYARDIAIHKLAGYQKPREPLCNGDAGNKEPGTPSHGVRSRMPRREFALCRRSLGPVADESKTRRNEIGTEPLD